MSQVRVIQVATDEVHIGPGSALVYSTHANPNWDIREFCSTAVYIQGVRYRVVQRRELDNGPRKWGYELLEWSDQTLMPKSFVEFNEDFVLARNRDQRSEQITSAGHLLLKPFFPFLGFAWSGFKEKVLVNLGFNPHSITSASVMVELGVFLLEGIFVGYLNGGFLYYIGTTTRVYDFMLLLLLMIDGLIRGNQVIRGDEFPFGFLEWANPAAWKKDR